MNAYCIYMLCGVFVFFLIYYAYCGKGFKYCLYGDIIIIHLKTAHISCIATGRLSCAESRIYYIYMILHWRLQGEQTRRRRDTSAVLIYSKSQSACVGCWMSAGTRRPSVKHTEWVSAYINKADRGEGMEFVFLQSRGQNPSIPLVKPSNTVYKNTG